MTITEILALAEDRKGPPGDRGPAGRSIIGARGEKGDRGPEGRAGLLGPAGPRGAQGKDGATVIGPGGLGGPQGPPGRDGQSVEQVTAISLSPDNDATAAWDKATGSLVLGIPRGQPGAPGTGDGGMTPFFATSGSQGPAGPPGPQGEPGPAGPGGGSGSDANFVHTQSIAADLWDIAHNLGKRPSVMIVTSAGDVVEGDIHYVDDNHVQLAFGAPFGGLAYFN